MEQIDSYEEFEKMYPYKSSSPASARPTTYPCFGEVEEYDAGLMGSAKYVVLVYPPAECHLKSFMMGLNAR